MNTIILHYLKWGGVNLTMKKIISSREAEQRRRREPVFWDSVEKSGQEEESSTFTGLTYEETFLNV